jgi:hypothetical protein
MGYFLKIFNTKSMTTTTKNKVSKGIASGLVSLLFIFLSMISYFCIRLITQLDAVDKSTQQINIKVEKYMTKTDDIEKKLDDCSKQLTRHLTSSVNTRRGLNFTQNR